MSPVAFELGPLTIRWYGIFVALGFLAGFALVQYRAPRHGFRREAAADLVFAAMLGGIVGARLFYVLQNWRVEFSGNLLEIVRIDHGGLVFYGGFFGAVAALALLCRRRSWAWQEVADLLAPALPLGHAFGRVGCFLNGCCFGRPWSGWGAVRYPALVDGQWANAVLHVQVQKGLLPPGAAASLPVFPVQLVSAAMNLVICGVLLGMERQRHPRGALFAVYLGLYGLGRFAVEFGRGDQAHFCGVSPAQLICLPLVAVAALWMVRLYRRAGSGSEDGQ